MRLISATVVYGAVIRVAVLTVFIPTVRAQFTSDYQTNIISGVVSNWSGNYIVGSNTSFNLLQIDSGGSLSNAAAYVGYTVSASNNAALVTDSGSVWSSSGTLDVGYSSVGNSLTISNGGTVLAQFIRVGTLNGAQGSMNIVGGSITANSINLACLSGATGSLVATKADIIAPSSVWVGVCGSGSMFLSNCTASVGFLGLATCSGSRGTLTAVDSTLGASGNLSIGDYYGTGAVWITGGQLVATNGGSYVANLGTGQITCSNSIVNLATLTISASSMGSGTLAISGGSLSARQFDVGHAGTGSTGAVWICDGATVTATNDTSIVGESGIGSMAISNSTVRLAALTLAKYFLVDTYGTLTVAGGTVTLTGALTAGEHGLTSAPFGSKGVIWLMDGRLIVTNAPTYLGVSGTGQMTVSNSVFLAQSINLDGHDSTLALNGGTIAIAGATAIASTGTADMIVSNGTMNSLSLRVAGYVGSAGTLHVCGGSLNIANQMIFGREAGPTASVWVTGGQLTMPNGEVHLGDWCETQMTISNGTVNAFFLRVANGNVGTLTIAGGRLVSTILELTATINATATVWVTGGEVEADVLNMGAAAGVMARMVVSNGIVSTPWLAVGFHQSGLGTFELVSGSVSVDREFSVAGSPGATGLVWMTGGELLATNVLSIGATNGSSSLDGSAFGQMSISNGAVATSKLMVGAFRKRHGRLVIAGGNVAAGGMLIGTSNCDGTGSVAVTSGSLFVTNASHDAVLEVRSGTFTMGGGNVVVDKLVITNACGRFFHTGGDLSVGALILDPNLDADGDGIPNGYEQSHGLDPLNPADANVDSDGDGMNNLQEFQTGTDPTNSTSAFRILSIVPTNNDLLISWAAGGGRTNMVQSAPDLASSYTNVSPNIVIPGSGDATTNYLDAGAMTNAAGRFYRIRLVP